jgi:broad specificity phosphatase PhoE
VNLYLIRHGETAHNRDGRGLGRDDVPLTPFGELQASALGGRLAAVPLDRVFSSPLGRARQTAEALIGGRGIPVEIRHELIEMDVGESDGLTILEVQERFPQFLAAWRSESCAAVKMPGGESLADVAERLGPFLTELRETPAQAVAVVSHNFVIKVALCRLLELDLPKFRGLTVDVASLTTVSLRDGRVNVRALNDSCHLVPLEP